ncbi:DUF4856 domain-containing protein [Ferrimonas balearica]|uniref:DUF4856 domain-containing protein n=1 Tax=Ferrimonas balearica TaxID=44012 RepID=UPI001C99B70E|nr:DUF4856 domain-containing protein [Ferrimonas balearica]MBY5921115.1 DUF4856 domain-containing protein [Ferrimonas balearica]MBY5996200.1 DUF4856 domain-containing protein [Ferrimonas balearica]
MELKKTLIATAILSTMLTACGGGSGSSPAPSNSAPTDITLSNTLIDENSQGATIGQLSATDADAGDSFTFSTDDERFVINGDTLALAEGVALNFEAANTVDVVVSVTDSADNRFSKTLTIDVNDLLDTYTFTSRFGDGSSVSYSGQTARHVLIAELNDYIGNHLEADLENGTLTSKADVIAKLKSFYVMTAEEYDLTAENIMVDFIDGAEQASLADISSSHKDLSGKIAGNDPTGQHKDWNNGEFAGWGTKGSTTPEALVYTYFDMLGDHAQAYLDGGIRQDLNGNDITSIYLTTDGRDLKQLIQKFLLMAVAYSQGADDYLDADLDGKGLNSDNVANKDDKGYTSLEHTYDEGFGYFGAARDYLEYSVEELAGKGGRDDWQGKHDTDGNGKIDLLSEYNFGQSINAAKRDYAATVATSMTTDSITAFLNGRQIIADAEGALTTEQLDALKAQVKIAVDSWEMAIVATVVHYINDTHADLAKLADNSAEFSYSDLAKHWSEMKGFALGLQFNPNKALSDAQFEQLHTLMGDLPVLTGDVEGYQASLLEARGILAEAYSINADNAANW